MTTSSEHAPAPFLGCLLPWGASALVVGLLLLGVILRLMDATDPPLDFNATRQLRSAIIARGLYYASLPGADADRQTFALRAMNAMERLEPPVLEQIVAWGYRLRGEEDLRIARGLVTFFWLLAFGFLLDLGRRMTSLPAALIGSGVFLFLPFSVRASRSFQPDPGMVMLIVLTAWAAYRWQETPSWKRAILTGVLGGLAVLVKIMAVFFVGGVVVSIARFGMAWQLPRTTGSEKPRKRLPLLAPQVGVMLGLILLPGAVYYLTGLENTGGTSFLHWTIFHRWQDVLAPSFYMRWMVRLDDILGLSLVFAGLTGVFLASPRARPLLVGFWGGYFAFGLFFPYHILTHDYYHLAFVPLLSLSLMPLADTVVQALRARSRILQAMFALVVVTFFAYHAWIARSILVGQDFRDHPAFWAAVAQHIPEDAKAIGFSQDYGLRLMYYGWRKMDLWPANVSLSDFAEAANGYDYFVVTARRQVSPALDAYLRAHFPIHAEGDGYLIFDLRKPLP